jgi:hypothetical protein
VVDVQRQLIRTSHRREDAACSDFLRRGFRR